MRRGATSVPQAARSLLTQATVFTDPVSRAALELWRFDAAIAALAAGLLLGRASVLPLQAHVIRAQLALALMVAAAWAAPSVVQATLVAVLLPAATWVGQRHLSTP